MSDHERELPMGAAVSLFRAHLLYQRGELSEQQLLDALRLELAGHEDLSLVIEAQALFGAAILQTLEAVGPPGVTADGVLLAFGRDYD